MSGIYLPAKASRARLKEATAARENRHEIVRALSWGHVSRRDLLKYGLFTGAGLLPNPRFESVYVERLRDEQQRHPDRDPRESDG